jgi:hypothetical protein
MDNSVKRSSQIESEIKVLRASIEELAGIVALLNEKLKPVSRVEPPLIAKNDKVQESLVSLADEIRSNRYEVCRITSDITMMIELLEV